MPEVDTGSGKKHFPYTKLGIAAAGAYAKKTKSKVKTAKNKAATKLVKKLIQRSKEGVSSVRGYSKKLAAYKPKKKQSNG